MRGQAAAPGALWILGPLLLLLGHQAGTAAGTDAGPGAESCATLVQGKFFGYFSAAAVFPANASRCSWTLRNPDPRRYTLYVKVAKAPSCSGPTRVRTYQFDSFLESTRTYLGVESFDEVLRLCDPSAPLAFLQASKQFLQMQRQRPPQDDGPAPQDGPPRSQRRLLRGVPGRGQPQPQPGRLPDAVPLAGRLSGWQPQLTPLWHHADPLCLPGRGQRRPCLRLPGASRGCLPEGRHGWWPRELSHQPDPGPGRGGHSR